MRGFLALLGIAGAAFCAPGPADPPPMALERAGAGRSWVSPYWGYNTPKIVSDGNAHYTALLWGETPETAEVVVCKKEAAGPWREGARFAQVYQPATLLLDPEGRLLVIHTRANGPVRILRSETPGGVDRFKDLPPPPDMENAYYIGAAARGGNVWIAYVRTPDYSMLLARLDLAAAAWSPSVLLRPGAAEKKPKTAWTYPILLPAAGGIHVVASNAPDGGEGNTYNQVWHVFLPDGAAGGKPKLVAEGPVGRLTFAMDAVLDAAGAPHVAYLWNQRGYGDAPPADGPPEGVCHAWRDPADGGWRRARLTDPGYAGLFFPSGGPLTAVVTRKGTLVPFLWEGPGGGWTERPPLVDPAQLPAPPGFMDVVSPGSGGNAEALAVVCDGLLPATEGRTAERVVWSLLPR